MLAEPKQVAAVISNYTNGSQADQILGRILDGPQFDGRNRPDIQLASLYTAQKEPSAWGVAIARKHKVKVFPDLSEALTQGSPQLAVDGVIVIPDETADPAPTRPQIRFADKIFQTIRNNRRSVPVFLSGRLATTWKDASWIFDNARRQLVPLMAGSDLPFAAQQSAGPWRGCPLEEAVTIFAGNFENDAYGAIEIVQSKLEQRAGGETGVGSVQALPKGGFGRGLGSLWTNTLVRRCLQCSGHAGWLGLQTTCLQSEAVVVNYCCGLRSTIFFVDPGVLGNTHSIAARRGLLTCTSKFDLDKNTRAGRFGKLVMALRDLFHSQHAPYPPERNLLATGIHIAARESKTRGYSRIPTSYLRFHYAPY